MVEGDAPLDVELRFPVPLERMAETSPGYTANRAVNAMPWSCCGAAGHPHDRRPPPDHRRPLAPDALTAPAAKSVPRRRQVVRNRMLTSVVGRSCDQRTSLLAVRDSSSGRRAADARGNASMQRGGIMGPPRSWHARTEFGRVGAAVAITFTLVLVPSCSSSEPSTTDAGGDTTATAPEGDPVDGGTLAVGVLNDVDGVEPDGRPVGRVAGVRRQLDDGAAHHPRRRGQRAAVAGHGVGAERRLHELDAHAPRRRDVPRRRRRSMPTPWWPTSTTS